MYRVLSCLTGQHDYQLVALAAVICVLSAFTAFWLLPLALSRDSKRSGPALLLAGACTAMGIWATHFVAMLAYDAGLPVGYDLPLTLASLLIAIVMTSFGLFLMRSGRQSDTILAGAVIGLGIAAMHFTGMTAIVTAGQLVWDKGLVATAVLTGVALSCAATLAFTRWTSNSGRYAAPLLLTLAICSLHFTAMGAVTIVPDPTAAASTLGIDAQSLAIIVAGATVFLIGASVIASIVDRFTIIASMRGLAGAFLVSAVGALIVGLYAFEQARVGGGNYQRIVAGKDFVADILPPPLYIIDAYLEARLAVEEPERLDDHIERIEELREQYFAQRSHWQSSRLISDEVKEGLLRESDSHVEKYWNILEGRFLPSLRNGDDIDRRASLHQLKTHFNNHRSVIERLVRLTREYAATVESEAEASVGSLRRLAIGALALLVFVVASTMLAISRLLIRPVLDTAGHLDALSAGRYDAATPFTGRSDEIGDMARAIDALRLTSIEKLRLEQEAARSRLARDKERAAQALRDKMANESITGLNSELNGAIERLKQAQDEIVRKGRLAQLGQLTATVAHEIRNPLGAVKTAVYLIDRKTKDKGLGIEPQMQRVNNGILRCDKIITELLDFTRTKALAETAQPVDDWLQNVVDEERRSLSADVAIETRFGAAAGPILFDTGRMRRVVINLLSNAAEAMVGKAGEAPAAVTANPRISVTTRVVGGNVEIAVTDNGPGISPENLARIREPLFTTKSFGVGLGIPAIENILEQHGGGLKIDSAVGQGATMTAWFPVREASANSGERKVA